MTPGATGPAAPRSGRRRGAAPLVALLLALAVVVAPLATAPRAGAAAGVRVDVTTLTPAVATHDATLQVAGTVRNQGRQALRNASVRLRLSQTRLGSRSELDAVLAGKVSSRDGDVVVEVPLGDIAPGASAPFDIRQPLAKVTNLTGFGVYVLGVEVVGTRSGTTGRAAITRTLLPYTPPNPDYSPTGMTWVWPLVGEPVRLADGVFANDRLAGELAPGGRLDRLLQAGARLSAGAAVTWAIDPELVESVEAMADRNGYRVASPSGGTVPGGGGGLAQQWLAQLQSVTAGAAVVALPYADPDLTALVRHGLAGDVARTRSAGAAVLARFLPAASTVDGVAWPDSGYVDRPTLAALARSGVTSVVLDGRALPATIDLSYTPSGRAQLGTSAGRVAALLADPGLTDLLAAAPATSEGAVLAAQRVVADTAMITSELPNSGTDRTVLAMPPRRWNPSQAFLDQLLTLADAPWTAPVTLRELITSAPPEVDRGKLTYPAAQRRQELPSSYLSALDTQRENITNFAAILTDQTQLVPGLTSSLIRLESTFWRGRDVARGVRNSREQSYLNDLRTMVRVPAGSFTFGSRSGKIPVTVVNDLPQQVEVFLRLVPQTPRLRITAPTKPVVLGPRQKVQVEVPATAVAGGPVTVAATLHTPSGSQYGQPVMLRVNITQIGTVALVITVGAAVVLFLAAGIRVVRRLRRGRDGDDDGPTPETADHPADVTA